MMKIPNFTHVNSRITALVGGLLEDSDIVGVWVCK